MIYELQEMELTNDLVSSMNYIVCKWWVHCWVLVFPGGEQEWTHTTGELPLGVGTGWRWVQLVWRRKHGMKPWEKTQGELKGPPVLQDFHDCCHTKRSVSGETLGCYPCREKWWFATVFSLAQKCFHGDHPFFRIIPSTTSNETINHPSNRRKLEW